MVTDTSVRLNLSPCMHRHLISVFSGAMHFSAGEVWDDIHEHLLCLDCMEYVSEAEVLARWKGIDPESVSAITEEDTDVPF